MSPVFRLAGWAFAALAAVMAALAVLGDAMSFLVPAASLAMSAALAFGFAELLTYLRDIRDLLLQQAQGPRPEAGREADQSPRARAPLDGSYLEGGDTP